MSLLSDAAVQAIQESKKTEIIKVEDLSYLSRPVYLPPPEPRAETVIVHSLIGFCDYINDVERDSKDEPAIVAVQVCNPGLVRAWTMPEGREKLRTVAIEAQRFETKGFRWNQQLQAEEFIIGLQAHLVPNDDTVHLLNVVGNVTDSSTLDVADNGVSQTVKLKKGLTLTDKAPTELKSIVYLRPYRTFAELTQPVSPFVFRMARRDGALPTAALFEADDLKWKLEAMNSIREFLAAHITNLPILA